MTNRPVRFVLSRARAHVERAREKLYSETLRRSSVKRSLKLVEERLAEADESFVRVLNQVDATWRERFERLEKTADAMAREFDRTTGDLQKALADLTRFQERCRTLEAQLKSLTASQAAAEERIRAAEDRVVASETERAAEREQHRRELDAARSETTSRLADVGSALEAKLRDAQSRLSSTIAERASVDAERERLAALHLEQKHSHEEHVQSLTQALAASQAESEQRIRASEERVLVLEAELEAHQERHRRDLDAVRSEMTGQHADVVSALEAKLRDAESRLSSIGNERSSAEAERERLTALHREQIQTHEELAQSLRMDLADIERRLAQETEAKEAARSRVRSRLDRFGKREHEFEARASAFAERLAALETRGAELAQYGQDEHATRTRLEQTIAGLNAQLAAAESEAEAAKAARTQADSSWVSERADLMAACQESESRLGGLNRELSHAQLALRTAEADLADHTQATRDKIGTVAGRADELRHAIETLQERIRQLEQGTLNRLAEERKRADAQLADATTRTNEASAQHAREQSARNRLRRRTALLRRLFRDRLAGLHAQLQEQARSSLGQLQELQEAVAKERASRKNGAELYEEALKRNELLGQQVRSLGGELQNTTEQATELAKTNAQLSTSLRDVQTQLATAMAQAENGKANLARFETERARERAVAEETLRGLRARLAELESWVEARKLTPTAKAGDVPDPRSAGHPPTGVESRPIAQPVPSDLSIERRNLDQPAVSGFTGPSQRATPRASTESAGLGSRSTSAALPGSDEVDYLSHAIDHLLRGQEPVVALRTTESANVLPAAAPAPPQVTNPPPTQGSVPAAIPTSSAFEAETEQLRARFHRSFEQGQYADAANVAAAILGLAKHYRGSKHDYLDVCHRDLAIAQMMAGQLPQARENVLQALGHLEQTPGGTSQPFYAMRLADLAMVTLKLGQPFPAKQLLEQAVGIAQRILPPEDTIRRELERGLAVVRKQCEPPFDPGAVIVTATG